MEDGEWPSDMSHAHGMVAVEASPYHANGWAMEGVGGDTDSAPLIPNGRFSFVCVEVALRHARTVYAKCWGQGWHGATRGGRRPHIQISCGAIIPLSIGIKGKHFKQRCRPVLDLLCPQPLPTRVRRGRSSAI